MGFLIASPVLTHLVLAAHRTGVAPYALIVCQVLIMASLLIRRARPYSLLLGIGLIAVAAVSYRSLRVSSGLVLSSGLPHAAIYLGLFLLFGVSLLPGREPIVSSFARQIHGPQPREIVIYTRRVTAAWCAFFGLQILGSALLLAFAPVVWWSTFVNILNMPMVLFAFVFERLTRSYWVADPPRESLADVKRMAGLIRNSFETPGEAPR